MKQDENMRRDEAAVVTIGFLIVVVALATVSWQLAAALFGLGLMASVINRPRVRR